MKHAEGNYLGALSICSLVARIEEGERLGVILDAVADGAGHLLLLGGEMGAGKTRLLQHLMVEARHRDMEVLTGRCRDVERATPFYPVLAALSDLDTRQHAATGRRSSSW